MSICTPSLSLSFDMYIYIHICVYLKTVRFDICINLYICKYHMFSPHLWFTKNWRSICVPCPSRCRCRLNRSPDVSHRPRLRHQRRKRPHPCDTWLYDYIGDYDYRLLIIMIYNTLYNPLYNHIYPEQYQKALLIDNYRGLYYPGS